MRFDLAKFSNVSVHFSNNTILQNISCAIPNNTIIALIGPSGSGKTTFVKLLLELLMREKGWQIEGTIERFPGLRIGYVNQEAAFHLFANFVYEEFATISKENAKNLLNKMECSYLIEKRSLELSQGEKTIVAILRALSLNIQLLVLDEVMVNLSFKKRKLLENLLSEFKQNDGTVILVEHNPETIDFAEYYYLLQNHTIVTKHIGEQNAHPLQDCKAPFHSNVITSENKLVITNLQSQFIKLSQANPINFEASIGEIMGVSGDNGSGKSTLLEIICGIQKPEQGTIAWNNKELRKLRERKNLVSFYSRESIQQFSSNTVNFELANSDSDLNSDYVNTIYRLFNLAKISHNKISQLSFGEKQRLAIALTLISNATILVFDEPSYGMDHETLQAFYRALITARQQKKLIIIASHDNELLTKCAIKTLYL